ncbi:MAG: hypothetical protein DI598_09835 [Pseudopedobacter saltans]|uniref:TonB-dependent receptor plug domain-containing protein n=1 Tax=Pseudopedobacter saltans TaxID=151895 RepID=A0A2W5EX99_9SPHI|nr:MAG: hypothetical protein DI598_09835 [Pseudopedobacter saltans]
MLFLHNCIFGKSSVIKPSKSLLVLACLMLLNYVGAKEKTTVSLHYEHASLKKILSALETQAAVTITYPDSWINNFVDVSVNVSNAGIDKAIREVLKNLDIDYRKEGDSIVLFPNATKNDYQSQTFTYSAQDSIVGKVSDSSGVPIAGVSVMLKGSQAHTETDKDGKFTIAAQIGDTLVFHHMGFALKEQAIKNSSLVNVYLQSSFNALEEVVIIGYGTQKKKDITGAVASIGPKDLMQSPVANISNALAGRLPGLVTIQNSGEPGADGSNLFIRGLGTTGNNSPLVLVDGIQRTFSNIDPNEISDITILKDAASTAIYGIRGANGVILVTTKRGVNAQPSINVTAQNGWQSPTRLPQYANSYDALKLYREGLTNDGLSTTQYSDSILNLYRDRSHPAFQYLYPDVNWMDVMLKPSSYLTQANLNISGGSSFAKYFVSMSYLRQNGLYNFEDQIKQYNVQAVTNKYNFRSNIDLQITKDLTMELNLGAIVRDRNYPGSNASDIFGAMKRIPSWYFPLTNPDGSIPGLASVGSSPYSLLINSGYQRNFETTLQSTAGFKWNMRSILDGLSSRVRLSFDNLNYRDVSRKLNGSTYQYLLKPGILADTVTNVGAAGTYQTINQGDGTLGYDVNANGSRRTTLELYLNYDKRFGDHSLHGVLVYTQSSFFDQIGGGQSNAILGLPYKYDGLVGRISYNYNDKYLLEVNAGYNGSENFVSGHRLGFFPAISAGWNVSKERFIADNPAFAFLDNLKIRGSYGVVGNDQIGGSRFLYLSTWTITGGGYTFGQNRDGNSYSGAYETQTGNPAVTWEKSKNSDIGLDISLWKGALSITADYFWNHRTNILLTSKLIPSDIGIANIPPTNGGVINNKGYEFSIEHRKNFGKQGYAIRFNASYATNKIVYYAEPKYTGREWQAVTGTKIGQHYGYISEGFFKSADDILVSPNQSYFGAIQPGDIKYRDLNGDGVINNLDQGYLPNVTNPTTILGLSLSYHYMGLDASVFFQSGLGGSTMTIGSGIFPFDRFAGVLQNAINDHWVATNPDGNYMFPRISSQPNTNNQQSSTFWDKSSNYLRLKTIELGYSFSDAWLQRLKIKKARVFINGINLYTWDKLKIFDPEIASGGTGTYPQQKVINAGINFNF